MISKKPTVLPAIVLLAAATVHAQGRVTGRVVDQTGAALAGVSIDLTVGSRDIATSSDAAGAYRFDDVPKGTAELTFRLLNFTVARRSVDVAPRGATIPDVMLTLSLAADVVVTGAATFRNVADVEDPAASLVGIASAASQGAITSAQLEARPVMRAGEVLETVPGLVVSQHGGEGKANQYYLRGFNLDHGTDFSTTVAGVPVNTPTGAHAHGYADVSFLIPELVSGIQFKKGPYFADEGDFSAAGAASVNYVNRLERPIMGLSAGGDGWGRIFGAASPRLGGGYLLAAVELNTNDGPWVRPDDYCKVNGVVRFSRGDNRNGFSLTGAAYDAGWNSTDQVPARAVANGVVPRLGHVDETDGGAASRQSAAADIVRSNGTSSLRATGFLLRNRLNLFSNFTYFLDHPNDGDQFEQSERRVATGGRLTYRRIGRIFQRHAESAVGAQVRRDWLDPVGLYRTAARRRLSTTREDEVDQTMAGVYAQSEIEWTRALRTTFGVRADTYRFSVTSNEPRNSGNGSAQLVSPKFGAVVGPWSGTEIYVNAGSGFHSNDARGATIAADPSSGDAADRVTPLVRATGAEIGLRTVRFRGVQSTVALWYLGIDSELLFVGDAGTTEPGRPSRRLGFEWSTYARLTPWVIADGDVAFSRARFVGAAPAGNHIPGALDRVISAGITVESRQPFFGSLRLRHFGPRPLVEDGSVTSASTTVWNGEAGYRLSRRARVTLEMFNIFDAKASDIDYFYRSRLPGEPVQGIDDVHSHPAQPRTARVSLHMTF